MQLRGFLYREWISATVGLLDANSPIVPKSNSFKYETMSKNRKSRDGLVFSTDPDFFNAFQEEQDDVAEAPASKQKLRVWLDRKQRKGKEVTLIEGFAGPQSALEELAKWLKTKCGVGGAAKDGEILLQGDHRDKVVQLLIEKGYTQTKKAGG